MKRKDKGKQNKKKQTYYSSLDASELSYSVTLQHKRPLTPRLIKERHVSDLCDSGWKV